MRQIIVDRSLSFFGLILVILSGAVWAIKSEWGIWFTLIALCPVMLRLFASRFRLQVIDWLVILFALTAWSGYWAAYDQSVAWSKLWLIMTGVLVYFCLSAQPRENLEWVSVLFFCVGVGISLYYFLTYDFVAAPRKLEIVNALGRWIMDVRPLTSWRPIHPNYVAGVAAVTVPFIFYPVSKTWQSGDRLTSPFHVFVLLDLMLVGFALFMATSRGIVLALVSAAGAWLLWRLIVSKGIKHWLKDKLIFPIILLIYLCAVLAFLFLGPAQSGITFSDPYYFGTGSRAEVFERSIYLLLDYPITGGGLGSFPGLYSAYLLNIPFFNVSNSSNLFMDVFVEQGALGGISFLLIYAICLWTIADSVGRPGKDQLFRWLVLFCLIVAVVHGMVDDYLYNGSGSMLALFLAGLGRAEKRSPDVSSGHVTGRGILALSTVVLIPVAVFGYSQISGMWYANLGAVQLARVELADFPEAGWHGLRIVPKVQGAASALQVALRFDPTNLTANYRLGLIDMLRRDFESASKHLENAYIAAPNHRGIKKSLGYSYLWMGDLQKAQQILAEIPEASNELDAYYWWWINQDRADLANHAYSLLRELNSAQTQP